MISFIRTLSISQIDNIESILKTFEKEDTVFISLHIQEENDENYIFKCKKLCSLLKEKGIHIIADVSIKTESIFNMSLKEICKLLSLDVLRIDYGISLENIKELSKENKLAINASTFQENDLINLIKVTNKIIAIHNYYPRKETGLDFGYFDKQNEMFKKYNIPVYAFIKGSKPYRLPIKEGLPTLESQRDYSPHVAFIELAKYGKLDGVIIGDPNIDEKEINLIKDFRKDEIIPLKAKIDSNELFNKVFTNRIDSPSALIRIKESREYSCFGKEVKPYNTIRRKRGSITIDNINYSRYSGEIMIIRKDLKKDERVNVIGNIKKESMPLLDLINGNDKIKLIK